MCVQGACRARAAESAAAQDGRRGRGRAVWRGDSPSPSGDSPTRPRPHQARGALTALWTLTNRL